MVFSIKQRTGLLIVIIAFMTTVVRTESGVSDDVPDDVVYTDLNKTVYERDSVVLTCRFRGTPLAVWWKKGDDPETAPNLVSWIPTDNVTGLCEGERPCQIMEMDANRSLIIKEVSIAEQGRYICRVTIKGILIHNFTDISVLSPPQSPFPTIDQCPTDGRESEPCIMTQKTGVVYTELTCRTTGATRGVVSLSWTHGDTAVTLLAPHRSTNPDGVTEDVMVAINATPSADPYVCVAILSATTRRQATISVTVNAAPILIATTTDSVMTTNVTAFVPEPSKTKTTVIAVVIIFIIVLVVVVILIFRKPIKKKCRTKGYHHPKSHQIEDKGACKADGKAGQTERTGTGKAATEETGNVVLYHGGIANNEQDGKEEKEDLEKATNGDKLEDNTDKKGAKHGKENDKETEEEANIHTNGTDGEQICIDDDWFLVPTKDVMQEKSGDGAAASKENTNVNVDTKEQGNTPDGSDEHMRDESSETLF